jgi:hypothetical protein
LRKKPWRRSSIFPSFDLLERCRREHKASGVLALVWVNDEVQPHRAAGVTVKHDKPYWRPGVGCNALFGIGARPAAIEVLF